MNQSGAVVSVFHTRKVYFDLGMRRALEQWIRQVALGPLVCKCEPLWFLLASLWRSLMIRTTFIALTGSVGKTTTKELLAEILASKGRTFRTLGNQNSGYVVALNILRVRPWHRFAVIEVGIGQPGAMRRLAQLVRPHVALILGVLRTHTMQFQNLDQYADEKAILLQSLVPGGIAILNGDDPRVAKMGVGAKGRVCYTGTSSAFDFWIDQISSRWPERLRFRIHWGGEQCEVETQRVGAHWAAPFAAALAAAHTLGVRIPDAVRMTRQTLPYTARMEPILLPNGAVFIRDDFNGSIDTLEASLQVLREAEAARKVLVISDFTDAGVNRQFRLKYLASAVSDWLGVLVLRGQHHEYGRRRAIEAGMPPDRVHSFATLVEVADFLKRELRSGDLVLVRGRATDHMARLFFAQIGTLSCWREQCKKTMLCDTCWELGSRPDAAYADRYPAAPIFR